MDQVKKKVKTIWVMIGLSLMILGGRLENKWDYLLPIGTIMIIGWFIDSLIQRYKKGIIKIEI